MLMSKKVSLFFWISLKCLNYKTVNLLSFFYQEQTSEIKKCSQCLEAEYESEAALICKNENIALCNDCGRGHKLDDSTKRHVIVRLQDDLVICDLCLDSSIPGYGFCTDCKQTNPEILCLPCSKRHCSNEEFANHKICTNLDLMKHGERYSITFNYVTHYTVYWLKYFKTQDPIGWIFFNILHTLQFFVFDLIL